MGMKKATRERITAAYEKGFTDGETVGYDRAKAEFEARRSAVSRRTDARETFAESLKSEGEPEPETDYPLAPR